MFNSPKTSFKIFNETVVLFIKVFINNENTLCYNDIKVNFLLESKTPVS